MKPIRVLEIISGFAVEGPLGGIERFGIELAQALDRTKIEPVLCGMWAYGTAYEYGWINTLQERNVKSFIVTDWDEAAPYKSFWRVYRKLPSFIDQVDIIHSHCQFGDLLALLIKKQTQARVLVRTVHNEKEWGKRPLRHLFLTNGLYPLMFNQELGVAQQVVNNLNQRPVARLRQKTAIRSYNALNPKRFSSAPVDIAAKKQSLGFAPTSRIVGTVGRLSEQKGYTHLLEAAQIIAPKFPEVRFLIIGDGHLYAELQDQANRLGLGECVLFTGPRQDIEELLPTMDVFVNSSLWEGLPTVIMESMAARIPVVATDVGGNSELIENDVTGWLTPPAQPKRLAQAIELALQAQPTKIKLITENAFNHVTERFSITAVARQHEELYQQLFFKDHDHSQLSSKTQ